MLNFNSATKESKISSAKGTEIGSVDGKAAALSTKRAAGCGPQQKKCCLRKSNCCSVASLYVRHENVENLKNTVLGKIKLASENLGDYQRFK